LLCCDVKFFPGFCAPKIGTGNMSLLDMQHSVHNQMLKEHYLCSALIWIIALLCPYVDISSPDTRYK